MGQGSGEVLPSLHLGADRVALGSKEFTFE
jgi:hypothetical protein